MPIGQTCTLCAWCAIPTHVGPSAHIMVRHPSCTMDDEKHNPKKGRTCTCEYQEEPPPPTWIHDDDCPDHP